MAWEIELSDWLEKHWQELDEKHQIRLDASVRLLEQYGPQLPFPHSSGVEGSKFSHLRELRVQIQGEPYRYFYAFDPRRVAVLLCGGNKRGDNRFYERMINIADRLYEEHLRNLKEK